MKLSVVCADSDFDIDYQDFFKSAESDNQLDINDANALTEYLATITEKLQEYISDWLWDILGNLYPDGEVVGSFNLYDVYTSFIDKTKLNIKTRYETTIVEIFVFDDKDSVRGSSKINIADMLLELLEDASSDSGFDAVVGGYVESSLLDFVACSRWQFGYVSSNGVIVDSDYADKMPLLWYGPDNMLPNEKWSIKYGEQISECWFTDDDWELLNYFVEDCTESFSIWYRLECRMCLPDMEKILSECPVSFLETDCLEDINRKIMLFSEMRLNV